MLRRITQIAVAPMRDGGERLTALCNDGSVFRITGEHWSEMPPIPSKDAAIKMREEYRAMQDKLRAAEDQIKQAADLAHTLMATRGDKGNGWSSAKRETGRKLADILKLNEADPE